MPHSTTLADYRAALSTPGARGPVIAALFARLPVAMIGLALLLYVERATDSFAVAGFVSASTLTGVALGSVLQGRLIDRFGPSRPLYAASTVFALTVSGEILAVETDAPLAVLAVLALLVGLTQPTVGSASRALWTRLLPPGPTREAAYAYEAISLEVFFILGPGLAGLLASLPWPGTGVATGAALMLVGALSFASTRTVRAWRPEPSSTAPSRHLLGALRAPGMRTVALAALGFGVTIGFVEVAVPAAADEAGNPAMGGVLLSVWSLSSVAFGLYYGTRPWPRPIHLRLPALLGGFSLLIALLALPSSLFGLTVAMLVVGALITPQATAHSSAIELAAPAESVAEAFGWVVTSVTLGLAAGQSLSGQLVERSGPPAAYLAATACGLVLAALVWLRRRTLLPATGTPADTPAPEKELSTH